MNDANGQDIVNNSQTSAQYNDYYDKRWNELSSQTHTWKGEAGYGRTRVDFIDKVMKGIYSGNDLDILDLGCGTGWLSKALAPYGTVTGIDFAPMTIAEANEIYGDFGSFLVADPSDTRLGIPPNKLFDLVVSSEVIEHVEDHQAFLSQISMFLKPKGWLILTTPNQNLKRHVMRDPRKQKYIQPIENWLTPGELRRLLNTQGYKIARHEGFSTARNFGYTPFQKAVTSKFVRRVVGKLKLQSLYSRSILPLAMYQLLIAQKQ